MSLAGQLLGNYRLVRLVGQGGMGEVYLAEDTRLSRQVAVKVVREERQPYPNASTLLEARRLFQREMKAISQLDHPHILSFYDFGEEPAGNDSIVYMVMPYRSEGSLVDWLVQHGSELLDPQDVGYLISQVASALQHAHDQGIIHQDVKPSNFLVRVHADAPTHPDLFLTDFGIARMSSATSTASNSVRGTVTYMAPEQLSGDSVPATDQYALAVMAYQLLTGQLPFQGRAEQIMFHHLTTAPKPPGTLNPRLAPAVDSVILRALAKKPDERFLSIKAFASALQTALQSHPERHHAPALHNPPLAPGDIPLESDEPTFISSPDADEPTFSSSTVAASSASAPTVLGNALPRAGEPASIPPTIAARGEYPPTVLATPSSPRANESASILPTIAASPVSFSAETLPVNEIIPVALSGKDIINQLTPIQQKRTARPRAVLLAAIALVIILGGVLTTVLMNKTNNAHSIANDAATAQVQATIAARADPYQPSGALVFVDPLSQPGEWQPRSDDSFGEGCQYVNGVFQVSQSTTTYVTNCRSTHTYSNFTFEVKIMINQGACGGIMFRDTVSTSYYFHICQDGGYGLENVSSSVTPWLASGKSSAIRQGTGQENTIAVNANGNQFTLYINGQQISSANDNAYSQGFLTLVADPKTTVTYRDARLWTL